MKLKNLVFLKNYSYDFKSLILILLLCTEPITDYTLFNQFIIWNVGQGSWSTLIENNYCIHFDAGGEKFPIKKINSLCQFRHNIILFSHFDKDHYNGSYLLLSTIKKTCRFDYNFQDLSKTIPAKLKLIPICNLKKIKLNSKILDILNFKIYDPNLIFNNSNSKNKRVKLNSKVKSNDSSLIALTHSILIPGDSPFQKEKIWAPVIKKSQTSGQVIRKLILGHHGSKTSNSDFLFETISHLNQCFCSSRKQKYGHPHKDIIQRIKKFKCPLLTTEMWGHIHIIL